MGGDKANTYGPTKGRWDARFFGKAGVVNRYRTTIGVGGYAKCRSRVEGGREGA